MDSNSHTWPVVAGLASTALQLSVKFGEKKEHPLGSRQTHLPSLSQPRGKAPGRGQEKEAGAPSATSESTHSTAQQLQMGNIILSPEKIYLSIFLEPRKNNNILQEKRHKYPIIPYIISWDLPENDVSAKAASHRSSFEKGQSQGQRAAG